MTTLAPHAVDAGQVGKGSVEDLALLGTNDVVEVIYDGPSQTSYTVEASADLGKDVLVREVAEASTPNGFEDVVLAEDRASADSRVAVYVPEDDATPQNFSTLVRSGEFGDIEVLESAQTQGGARLAVGYASGRVAYLDGGLSTVASFSPTSSTVEHLRVADLDKDGDDDAVLTGGGALSVLTFESSPAAALLAVPVNWGGVEIDVPAVGDFDGDGDLDVLGLSRINGQVYLAWGDGALGFVVDPNPIIAPANVVDMRAHDFNDDGVDDLVFVHSDTSGFTVVLSDP